MKNFCDLPIVDEPGMALAIEDGVPGCVDMAGYRGRRGMAQLLKVAHRADDITELAPLAKALGVGYARIVRANDNEQHVGPFSNDFDCLQDGGITLFALQFHPGDTPFSGDSLQTQFAMQVVAEMLPGYGAWFHLFAHFIAGRFSPVPLPIPNLFTQLDQQAAAAKVNLWGLPVPVNLQQALDLARRISADCRGWDLARQETSSTVAWLEVRGKQLRSFEEMLHMYEVDRQSPLWPLVGQ